MMNGHSELKDIKRQAAYVRCGGLVLKKKKNLENSIMDRFAQTGCLKFDQSRHRQDTGTHMSTHRQAGKIEILDLHCR